MCILIISFPSVFNSLSIVLFKIVYEFYVPLLYGGE